jgi:PST family polysaccharide transporter
VNGGTNGYAGVAARLVGWQSLGVVVSQAVQSILVLVTASIVDPSQFALWAIASLIFNLQAIVGNLGLGPALIYRTRDGHESLVDTSVVLSAAVGGCLFLGAFLIAPLLASFLGAGFDEGEVIDVVRAMSIALLLIPPTQVAQALLERRLRFSTKAWTEIAAAGFGLVVTAMLLVAGEGVWALVWGRVASVAALLAATWLACDERPRVPPRASRATAGKLLGFGVPLTLAALLTFASMNADTVAMGRRFGADELGYYALAFTLANLVPSFLIVATGKVAFPLYVRAGEDRAELSTAFALMSAWTFAVMGITTVCLLTVAPEAIPGLLGEDWNRVGDFVQILSVYGLANAGLALNLTLLAAVGRPGESVRAQLVWLGAAAVLVLALVRFGPWSIPVAFTVGIGLAWCWATWRTRAHVDDRPGYLVLPALLASCASLAAALAIEALSGQWAIVMAGVVLVYGITLGFAVRHLPHSAKGLRLAIKPDKG